MNRVQKTGGVAGSEAEMLTAKGDPIWVVVSASRLEDEPAILVMTFHDITAQRLARQTIDRLLQRIKRSNERLGRRVETRTDELRAARDKARHARRQLVEAIEAISEGFVLYDSEDRFVLCNSRYRDEYSFAPEMLVSGTPYEEILRHGMALGRVPKQYDSDSWIQERLANHRKPRPALSRATARRPIGPDDGIP